MSTAREQIIGDIRRSLRRGDLPEAVQQDLRSRLSEPEQGIRPHFDQDPVERFVEKLGNVSATVSRVSGVNEVAAAIGQYLEQHELDTAIVMSDDALLEQVDWPDAWQIETRPARGTDRVSVTGAFCAIAETGTLALLSAAASPTTLNFLPDNHIVVIRAEQIVSHIEDLWSLMRKRNDGSPVMPRTVNLITGPSRTADVEQTIQLGAHGPRRFHVVLVDA